MIQLISFIIFVISVGGIVFILHKKIPVLVELPQNGHHGFKKHKLILETEKRIKDFYFDFFHKQVYLHKLLSFTKVWILKMESRVDELLSGIRKKTQELDKKKKKKR